MGFMGILSVINTGVQIAAKVLDAVTPKPGATSNEEQITTIVTGPLRWGSYGGQGDVFNTDRTKSVGISYTRTDTNSATSLYKVLEARDYYNPIEDLNNFPGNISVAYTHDGAVQDGEPVANNGESILYYSVALLAMGVFLNITGGVAVEVYRDNNNNLIGIRLRTVQPMNNWRVNARMRNAEGEEYQAAFENHQQQAPGSNDEYEWKMLMPAGTRLPNDLVVQLNLAIDIPNSAQYQEMTKEARKGNQKR